MKKAIVALLIVSIIMLCAVMPGFGAAAAQAANAAGEAQAAKIASKEEVIYAILDNTGEVTSSYVVNIFDVLNSGLLEDHGDYSDVKNLTTTAQITNSSGSISVMAEPGRFYYQGSLNVPKLPWDVTITYLLDGNNVEPDALAGRSGRLEINIKTARNPKVDAAFFDNYVLQASVKLDTKKCTDITAPGATLANAGADKVITFTTLPGKPGDMRITANVTDFELQGIEFSAVPFSMSIEMPDTSELSDDMQTLADAIAELDKGVGELQSGAKQLKNGAGSLKTGSAEFDSGIKSISAGSKELTDASAAILSALNQMSGGISGGGGGELAALLQLPAGLKALADGLKDIAASLDDMHSGYAQSYAALAAAINSIPDDDIPEAELQALLGNNPGNSALTKLIEYYQAAQTVRGTYEATSEALDAVSTGLPAFSDSIKALESNLRNTATQIENTLGKSDIMGQLAMLSQALSTLSRNYSSFHAGLLEYTGGISQLAAAYAQLHSGISALSSGAGRLYTGIAELKEGTDELRTETGGIPEQIDSFADELLDEYDKSDYVPESFVSDKNTSVASVQFVFRTSGISIAEAQAPDAEQAQSETFWTRLLKLFS